MDKKIKLMIIEDNTQLNEMLTKYFSTKSDIEVVGSSSSRAERRRSRRDRLGARLLVHGCLLAAPGLSPGARDTAGLYRMMRSGRSHGASAASPRIARRGRR